LSWDSITSRIDTSTWPPRPETIWASRPSAAVRPAELSAEEYPGRVGGERGHAGGRLDHVVEGRLVACRQAEAGERDADDLLVPLPQGVVGEPEPDDRRRFQVDQQGVRIGHELA
jgi:hypothetical protein